jgi:hypothetical protein
MRSVRTQQLEQTPEPLRWLAAVEAASFFFFALLHLGIRILPISEPKILPATVVETTAGLALAFSVYAAFTGKSWARAALIAATVGSIAGVTLGIAALAAGRGRQSPLNFVYHRAMLAALVGGLALLVFWRPRTRDGSHEATA